MLDDEALPIKCVSLDAVGSYDTHSDEHETLAINLGETIESVLAFQRDLEARGLADRVLIQLWFRASPAGKRVRHRPRCCRHGFRDRHAREGRNGRRVPWIGEVQ